MTVTPRVLLVHAHPDDETITTGGTIAELVSEGAEVMVLTATRGEGGEVIPAELKQLEGDRPGLARVREQEIAEAMRALTCACTPSSAGPPVPSRIREWNGDRTGTPGRLRR